MSAHSSWRCCTAGSMRCPRAERPFVRPRRAELLTVRLRRSARALAIVDVCDYDPGCGHGALSPCLQAVRRSRAGRHLLVLGLRPGSAGPGRLGLEVETAPAKIFRYILVSSSSRGCLSAAADVAATACPRTGRSPLAPPYPVRGGLRGLPWQSLVPVRAGGARRSRPLGDTRLHAAPSVQYLTRVLSSEWRARSDQVRSSCQCPSIECRHRLPELPTQRQLLWYGRPVTDPTPFYEGRCAP